jgi:hypothetical protein
VIVLKTQFKSSQSHAELVSASPSCKVQLGKNFVREEILKQVQDDLCFSQVSFFRQTLVECSAFLIFDEKQK